jgi:hypothetical protein
MNIGTTLVRVELLWWMRAAAGIVFAAFLWTCHSAEVLFAIVAHRHGARSPAYCFPLDVDPSCTQAVWPDGLGMLTSRGVCDPDPRSCGFLQFCDVAFMMNRILSGEQQLKALGVALKQRYVSEHKLVRAVYNREDLYARSTDYDRTMQSVEALLEGLFPAEDDPVPVHVGTLSNRNGSRVLRPCFSGFPPFLAIFG